MLSESVVHVNGVMILQFDFLRLLHFTILRNFSRKRRLKKRSMFLYKNKQTNGLQFFLSLYSYKS